MLCVRKAIKQMKVKGGSSRKGEWNRGGLRSYTLWQFHSFTRESPSHTVQQRAGFLCWYTAVWTSPKIPGLLRSSLPHLCQGATSKALVRPAFLKYPRPLYWGCVFHLLMGLALHKKQSVRPRASQASSRPLVLISASVVPTTVKSYGRSMFHASETQAFILTKI